MRTMRLMREISLFSMVAVFMMLASIFLQIRVSNLEGEKDSFKNLVIQAFEVGRLQVKVREAIDNLSNFEAKLNMTILGKQAVATVEEPQPTFDQLITMVEAEKHHNQKVLQKLDQLEGEMLKMRQKIEASTTTVSSSLRNDKSNDKMDSFLAEVIHPYQEDSRVDTLSLKVGDYVVVQKVCDNGWARGEYQGKAGWFPFKCVKRRD